MIIIPIVCALISGVVLGCSFLFLGFFPRREPYLLRYLLFSVVMSVLWPVAIPVFLIWKNPIHDWITGRNAI